jgi:hypothetical protein
LRERHTEKSEEGGLEMEYISVSTEVRSVGGALDEEEERECGATSVMEGVGGGGAGEERGRRDRERRRPRRRKRCIIEMLAFVGT